MEGFTPLERPRRSSLNTLPLDAQVLMLQNSPSSTYLISPTSPKSVDQIWDEGVDRIREREKYRDQRLSPAANERRVERGSEATLLDVIAVYQNRISSMAFSPRLASQFSPRMVHSPSFTEAIPEEKEKVRSDSAVSVNEEMQDRERPRTDSRTIPSPQAFATPKESDTSTSTRSARPCSAHSNRAVQRPCSSFSQPIPPPLKTAKSFPAPAPVFDQAERLPRTSSRYALASLSPLPFPPPGPLPSLPTEFQKSTPKLLPSALAPQDSVFSTPFSSRENTPLPSPKDIFYFPTPPTSSHSHHQFVLSSENLASSPPSGSPLEHSPLALMQPIHLVRSAFDDDDDEDEDDSLGDEGLVEKWKKSLQLRRSTRRTPSGDVPVKILSEEKERVLREKREKREHGRKRSWREGCGCFGQADDE
ncbi:hypothetical protein EJ05DRAFT_393397 [Pseudovirgaria hyperparasitica]|uniref:Uncharacterized protein n=1 Tax=Pseudovirgaria hyperparasitica TaxID=470096 RepID=A0A6A6W8X2_9PEZI|nr:uncharacterized protein EJ05DRAFT_393397 [Pseudovirgaria hyperparasitica]KAF2757541.1 hypothetical protein EJ05DRAFT_393397 [Pseudovirgaria hyperparasitica]